MFNAIVLTYAIFSLSVVVLGIDEHFKYLFVITACMLGACLYKLFSLFSSKR